MAYTSINKPTDYFNTITWSGDNSTGPITGVGFAADFVWWKQRNGTDSFRLADSVRGEGTNTYKLLFSEGTYAEFDGNDNGGSQGNIDAINSDGYTGVIGTTGYNNWNGTGYNYVSWNWLAGGTASSNTDGSITSSVSANTTSGFSIVSYAGNSTSGATIGHGLGAVPNMIIVKSRTTGTYNWAVYHSSVGATKYLRLNSTIAATTSSTRWNDTTPSSSVFTLGDAVEVNETSNNYIAYCFAEKKGYSKFGKYTGTGGGAGLIDSGPFIYTGFKPAFYIWKKSSAVDDWYVLDNKRDTFNISDAALFPGLNGAESDGGGSYNGVDFLSNGIKIRNGNSSINASGETFIYMAFAESPFCTSTGTPVTAR